MSALVVFVRPELRGLAVEIEELWPVFSRLLYKIPESPERDEALAHYEEAGKALWKCFKAV